MYGSIAEPPDVRDEARSKSPAGRSPTRPVAGFAGAATAGYAGRPISTGSAAAVLAEFAIIGTDRAALDPA
jgi:hypothetical protein